MDFLETSLVVKPKSLNISFIIQPLIALLAVLLLVPTSVFAEKLNVQNIRVAKNGQVTRIVFDTSTTPFYKIFTLNNPSRVVIDLTDAKLATIVDQSVFDASFVQKLRHANRSQNKLRIVLELNQKIIPKSFVLPPNDGLHHRLVIDLKNAKVATPLIARTTKTKPIPTQAKSTPKIDIITKVTTPSKAQKPKIVTATKFRPKSRTIVVAIDPGHGGKDPGATGYAGTREKDVVLQISKRLARLINAESGMRVIMTRATDNFLTLRGRIKKARSQKADIFISVHADAVGDRRVRGSSVYVLSKNGASSEAARFLAQSQNQSDVIGGVNLGGMGKDVQKVLVDLSQAKTIDASMKLANSVKKELTSLGKTRKDVEHAGFAVLKSPDIPSILVETAFISNASEEKKLRSATHQQKLASSIFRGLKSYLKHHTTQDAVQANNIKKDKHTIKYGETLSEIAVRYSVSIDSLRRTNALSTNRIRVGQKLIIPEV